MDQTVDGNQEVATVVVESTEERTSTEMESKVESLPKPVSEQLNDIGTSHAVLSSQTNSRIESQLQNFHQISSVGCSNSTIPVMNLQRKIQENNPPVIKPKLQQLPKLEPLPKLQPLSKLQQLPKLQQLTKSFSSAWNPQSMLKGAKNSNSTVVESTLKRNIEENAQTTIPSKLQKLKQPVPVALTKVGCSSNSSDSQKILIERIFGTGRVGDEIDSVDLTLSPRKNSKSATPEVESPKGLKVDQPTLKEIGTPITIPLTTFSRKIQESVERQIKSFLSVRNPQSLLRGAENSNSAVVESTLKRKIEGNMQPTTSSKVQKLKQPVPVAMTKVVCSNSSSDSQKILIERIFGTGRVGDEIDSVDLTLSPRKYSKSATLEVESPKGLKVDQPILNEIGTPIAIPLTTFSRKNQESVTPVVKPKVQRQIKSFPSAWNPQPILRGAENSNSTVVGSTLKQKIEGNMQPTTSSKVQKPERPVQVAMTKGTSFTQLSHLPEISIEPIRTVGRKSSIVDPEKESKELSHSECLKLLKENDVKVSIILKQPTNMSLMPKQPVNNTLDDKYILDSLARNNISVERLRKNN